MRALAAFCLLCCAIPPAWAETPVEPWLSGFCAPGLYTPTANFKGTLVAVEATPAFEPADVLVVVTPDESRSVWTARTLPAEASVGDAEAFVKSLDTRRRHSIAFAVHPEVDASQLRPLVAAAGRAGYARVGFLYSTKTALLPSPRPALTERIHDELDRASRQDRYAISADSLSALVQRCEALRPVFRVLTQRIPPAKRCAMMVHGLTHFTRSCEADVLQDALATVRTFYPARIPGARWFALARDAQRLPLDGAWGAIAPELLVGVRTGIGF